MLILFLRFDTTKLAKTFPVILVFFILPHFARMSFYYGGMKCQICCQYHGVKSLYTYTIKKSSEHSEKLKQRQQNNRKNLYSQKMAFIWQIDVSAIFLWSGHYGARTHSNDKATHAFSSDAVANPLLLAKALVVVAFKTENHDPSTTEKAREGHHQWSSKNKASYRNFSRGLGSKL